ncbi:MAG: hypothetical protein MZU79_06070 [Anaerotruncus sp.]|nr:hypothetical protein [Anaerotruncus sp.]
MSFKIRFVRPSGRRSVLMTARPPLAVRPLSAAFRACPVFQAGRARFGLLGRLRGLDVSLFNGFFAPLPGSSVRPARHSASFTRSHRPDVIDR